MRNCFIFSGFSLLVHLESAQCYVQADQSIYSRHMFLSQLHPLEARSNALCSRNFPMLQLRGGCRHEVPTADFPQPESEPGALADRDITVPKRAPLSPGAHVSRTTFPDVRLYRFDTFDQRWRQVAAGDLHITECAEPLTTMLAMRMETPQGDVVLDQASLLARLVAVHEETRGWEKGTRNRRRRRRTREGEGEGGQGEEELREAEAEREAVEEEGQRQRQRERQQSTAE